MRDGEGVVLLTFFDVYAGHLVVRLLLFIGGSKISHQLIVHWDGHVEANSCTGEGSREVLFAVVEVAEVIRSVYCCRGAREFMGLKLER